MSGRDFLFFWNALHYCHLPQLNEGGGFVHDNVVHFPVNTVTGVRHRLARALASDSDRSESGHADNPLPLILLPVGILLDFGDLAADVTFRCLGGGVGSIQQRTRFLFIVPKR